jgi:hypothetical protein
VFGAEAAARYHFGVSASAKLWSYSYAVFALLCAATGAYSLRPAGASEHVRPAPPTNSDQTETLTTKSVALWLLLSSTGTCTLLAISNHITQNIASAPFIWVLPLSLYLLTFIICFDRPSWYVRRCSCRSWPHQRA